MRIRFKSMFVTLALLLFMPFSLRAASAPTKIVVTYGGLNERSGVLFVAKDAGIFQKYGLDAQVVNVRSGAVGLSALAAGETQFHGGSATGASIGAIAGGVDLVFVAGLINNLMALRGRPQHQDARGPQRQEDRRPKYRRWCVDVQHAGVRSLGT